MQLKWMNDNNKSDKKSDLWRRCVKSQKICSNRNDHKQPELASETKTSYSSFYSIKGESIGDAVDKESVTLKRDVIGE